MTSYFLVKLMVEKPCYECNCRGKRTSKTYPECHFREKTCPICRGRTKLLYSICYTHERNYEDALKKLLARLSKQWNLSMDDKYFLVWAAEALIAPIDITQAVVKRLKENAERRDKLLKKMSVIRCTK